MSFTAAACHRTQSDDSSSSIGELMLSRDKGLSSLHQVRGTTVWNQSTPRNYE